MTRITPLMVQEAIKKFEGQASLVTGSFYNRNSENCRICPLSMVLADKLGLQELITFYRDGIEPTRLLFDHLGISIDYMWGFVDGVDGNSRKLNISPVVVESYSNGFSDGAAVAAAVFPNGTRPRLHY